MCACLCALCEEAALTRASRRLQTWPARRACCRLCDWSILPVMFPHWVAALKQYKHNTAAIKHWMAIHFHLAAKGKQSRIVWGFFSIWTNSAQISYLHLTNGPLPFLSLHLIMTRPNEQSIFCHCFGTIVPLCPLWPFRFILLFCVRYEAPYPVPSILHSRFSRLNFHWGEAINVILWKNIRSLSCHVGDQLKAAALSVHVCAYNFCKTDKP